MSNYLAEKYDGTQVWPRWLLPVAGSAVLVILFGLAELHLIPAVPAFAVMLALVLIAVVIGLSLPDTEATDRRSDLPIVMGLTWAVLALLSAGLLIIALAVISWPVFIFGAGYAVMHDYAYRWIALGFAVLIVLNLVVFYAYWRPGPI